MESKYLRFTEDQLIVGKKTKVFYITSKSSGDGLGFIKWKKEWRRYVFETSSLSESCVFDVNCLLDIAGFIKGLMDERKK